MKPELLDVYSDGFKSGRIRGRVDGIVYAAVFVVGWLIADRWLF
jgi:hypothetical protein